MTKLAKTPEYKSWASVVKKADAFPLGDLEKRVKDTIKRRKISELNIKRASARTITDVSMQETNARTILVGILLEAKKMSYWMEQSNSTLRDYIIASGWVEGRNDMIRRSAANSILKQGIETHRKLTTFIEVVEYWVEDIDKTYWQLKLQLEGLNTASKPELVL